MGYSKQSIILSVLHVLTIFAILAQALSTSIPDIPPPIDGNLQCSTTGSVIDGKLTAPTNCPSPLTCVLTSFGLPGIESPTIGVCKTAPSPLSACTVQFCSSEPTDSAICQVDTGETVTCQAWATRMDGSDDKPNCDIICTQECLSPLLRASDGSTYCNACILSAASCRADFSFYGPVDTDEDECDNPSVFDAPRCCTERQIGCIPVGETCSTAGSMVPTIPCEQGSTCVIDDFGFPAADRPNSGTCTVLKGDVEECSPRLCQRADAGLVCGLMDEGIVTTCGAWRAREDDVDDECVNPSPFDAPRCCTERQIGCVQVGQTCSSSGSLFPPIPCELGSTCVIEDFGFPAADRPNSGTCTVVKGEVEDCNPRLCQRADAGLVCGLPDEGIVTTCGAWRDRDDDECENPSPFDAARCCIERQMGCREVGEMCSTAGSRIAPVPCEQDSTCVISDFGFPAADRPNSGTCTVVRRKVVGCNVGLCAREGAAQICGLEDEGIVTTCGAWSKREDGGKKPNCKFWCTGICKPKWRRPKASNFKKYCNACCLKKKSCKSGFQIFGPIS